jgi:integrase
VSRGKTKAVEGIFVRHRKGCRSREGGRCDCQPSYQAHVYDGVQRRQIKRTFPTLAAAKRWRSEALVAVRSGELRQKSATPKLADALEQMLDAMTAGRLLNRSGEIYKPGTIRNYEIGVRCQVIPRLGHFRVHELQRRDVQRMIDELHAEGVSPSKIRQAVDPIRVLFREAIRRDEVKTTPCHYLALPANRPKPKAALAPEQIEKLLAALPDEDRALWATAFYAGLRRGELRALRWKDVDLARSSISVSRSWDDREGEQTPKSRAGIREVLILPALSQILAAHGLETGRSGNDLVFGRNAETPFSQESISRRSKAAWRAAGLEPTTLHHGRHCAASILVAAGLDVKTVQTYLGHSDSRVTLEIYAHALPDRHQENAERVQAFLRGE